MSKKQTGYHRVGGIWAWTCYCAEYDGMDCIKCGEYIKYGDRLDKYGNHRHVCGTNICDKCTDSPARYKCLRCGNEFDKDKYHDCPLEYQIRISNELKRRLEQDAP